MDANDRKPPVTPPVKANAHGVAVEPDRVATPVVAGLAAVLIGFAILGSLVTFALFRGLEKKAVKTENAAIEAAGLELRQDVAPPNPRLQVYPVRHWKDFRSAEAERLSTYGWMDRATGSVHIPIERAIALTAERGVGPLASAPAAAAPVAVPAAEAKK